MGKISENTSLKISDFIFRFRESSQRFVREILTQNVAFNLSGTLFFIGLGCSLKWWYKDQLFMTLLKQNLPAFSQPDQKICWETNAYFIEEQTRQFIRKKPNPYTFLQSFSPSFMYNHATSIVPSLLCKTNTSVQHNASNTKKVPASCSARVQGDGAPHFFAKHEVQRRWNKLEGAPSEVQTSITLPVYGVSLPSGACITLPSLKDFTQRKQQLNRFGVDSPLRFAITKDLSSDPVSAFPSKMAVGENKVFVTSKMLQETDAPLEKLVGLKDSEIESILTPQMRNFPVPPYNKIIDRLDLYSNSLVVNLRSPWQKHAYHRFVGIFPELISDNTALLQSKEQMRRASFSTKKRTVSLDDERAFQTHWDPILASQDRAIESKQVTSEYGRRSEAQSSSYQPLESNRTKSGILTAPRLSSVTQFAPSKYTFWKHSKNWFKLSARGLCLLNDDSRNQSSLYSNVNSILFALTKRTSNMSALLVPQVSASRVHGAVSISPLIQELCQSFSFSGTELSDSPILNKARVEIRVIVNNQKTQSFDAGRNVSTNGESNRDTLTSSLDSSKIVNKGHICCAKQANRLERQMTNFSYPLELTQKLNGWQPPIKKLILNSYLDEIPYKLENTLWATASQFFHQAGNNNYTLNEYNGKGISLCTKVKTPTKGSSKDAKVETWLLKEKQQLIEIKQFLKNELQILVKRIPVTFVDQSFRSESNKQTNNVKSYNRKAQKKSTWLKPTKEKLDALATFDAKDTSSLNPKSLCDIEDATKIVGSDLTLDCPPIKDSAMKDFEKAEFLYKVDRQKNTFFTPTASLEDKRDTYDDTEAVSASRKKMKDRGLDMKESTISSLPTFSSQTKGNISEANKNRKVEDLQLADSFSLLNSLGMTFNNLSYLKDPPVLLATNQDASYWKWNSMAQQTMNHQRSVGNIFSALYIKDEHHQANRFTRSRQENNNIVTETTFRFDPKTMTWRILQQLNCGQSFKDAQTFIEKALYQNEKKMRDQKPATPGTFAKQEADLHLTGESLVGTESAYVTDRIQKPLQSAKQVYFINQIILKQKNLDSLDCHRALETSFWTNEPAKMLPVHIDYNVSSNSNRSLYSPIYKSLSPLTYTSLGSCFAPCEAKQEVSQGFAAKPGGGTESNPYSMSLVPLHLFTESDAEQKSELKTSVPPAVLREKPIYNAKQEAKHQNVKKIFDSYKAKAASCSSEAAKTHGAIKIDLDHINPIDTQISLKNKRVRLMSGYIYPDTESASLMPNLYRWAYSAFPFDGTNEALALTFRKPQFLNKVIFDASITGHGGSEMASTHDWLLYSKMFQEINRLIDQACLFKVCTSGAPITIGCLSSPIDLAPMFHDIPENYNNYLSEGKIDESQADSFAYALPAMQYTIDDAETPGYEILPVERLPVYVQRCKGVKKKMQPSVVQSSTNTANVRAKMDQAMKSQNVPTLRSSPNLIGETSQAIEKWNFEHHLGYYPGFAGTQNSFEGFSPLRFAADGKKEAQRKGLENEKVSHRKMESQLFDSSPRKTAYNGIVVQRSPFTKDFQLSKKRLERDSILGTSLFGPENPFTDRQSHFFGQRRLSTVDANVFQRDYLRQLGKETLLQSKPKGFAYGASVERVKILSFSKAINSFLSKKRKYTYLLEEKDQWPLLFQEQLRTALQDTRKYPLLTIEESKEMLANKQTDSGPGRIKISAPLMMARFPKKSNSYKILAHYNKYLVHAFQCYGKQDIKHKLEQIKLVDKSSTPFCSQISAKVHQISAPCSSKVERVQPIEGLMRCKGMKYSQMFGLLGNVHLPGTKQSKKTDSVQNFEYIKQASVSDLPRHKDLDLAAAVCAASHKQNPIDLQSEQVSLSLEPSVYAPDFSPFSETWSESFHSAPLLDKSSFSFANNNLSFLLGQQWLTQEPLNANSWLIMSQWSFLVALLFWIEQTFLADIFPALFALEQLLLGTTGMKSDDRSHVTRVSKGDIPKFKDIAGIDGLLGELAELVLFLRGHKKRLWNKRSAFGVLLTGPPGTGKTFLVRALANEAKVPVLILSAGVLTANKTNNSKPSWSIRHAFRRAKQLAPCILFIDEIDALGRSRGNIVTDINEIRAGGQNVQSTPLSNSNFFETKASAFYRSNTSLQQQLLSATETRVHQINSTSRAYQAGEKQVLSISAYNQIDRYSLCADTNWLINRLAFSSSFNSAGVLDNTFLQSRERTKQGTETQIPNIDQKPSGYTEGTGHPSGVPSVQTKENMKRKFGPLTQLLVSMDGVSNLSGVLIIGATNRPESLDPALTRPGRFERIIRIEKPAEQKRIEILKLYSHNLGIQKPIPWSYLANRTMGLTAADLAVAMNYSSLKAILQGTTHTIETIEYGLDSIARISNREFLQKRLVIKKRFTGYTKRN